MTALASWLLIALLATLVWTVVVLFDGVCEEWHARHEGGPVRDPDEDAVYKLLGEQQQAHREAARPVPLAIISADYLDHLTPAQMWMGWARLRAAVEAARADFEPTPIGTAALAAVDQQEATVLAFRRQLEDATDIRSMIDGGDLG